MRLSRVVLVGAVVLGSPAVFSQPVARARPELRVIVDGGITVQFAGMRGGSGDWIALARPGSGGSEYLTYQYTGDRPRGRVTFDDPGEGTYVVRAYFGSSSYVIRAESEPFHVADRCGGDRGDGPTIRASPDGEHVFVRFAGLCRGTPTDWVAIAPAGAAPQSYQAWRYTDGSASGIVDLTGLPPGQWVARLYTNWTGTRSYTVRAESVPFWIAPPGCVCGDAAAQVVGAR